VLLCLAPTPTYNIELRNCCRTTSDAFSRARRRDEWLVAECRAVKATFGNARAESPLAFPYCFEHLFAVRVTRTGWSAPQIELPSIRVRGIGESGGEMEDLPAPRLDGKIDETSSTRIGKCGGPKSNTGGLRS